MLVKLNGKMMNNVQICRYHAGVLKFYSNTRKKSSAANLPVLEKLNMNPNPKKWKTVVNVHKILGA